MTTQPLTAAERERLRDRHRPMYGNPAYCCAAHRESWPCTTIRLLDEVETLQRREDALVEAIPPSKSYRIFLQAATGGSLPAALGAIVTASDARKVNSP